MFTRRPISLGIMPTQHQQKQVRDVLNAESQQVKSSIHRKDRNTPENWLECSRRSVARTNPSSVGMVPEKWLSKRNNLFILVINPNSLGTVPLNSPLSRIKVSIAVRYPKAVGSVPVIKFA